MRRFTLRLTIALLTFIIGAVVASMWISKHRLSIPSIKQNSNQSSECIPVYDPSIAAKRLREDDDAKAFAAFKELPLEALPACVDESYRLMWFPTFHSPVVVRLWRAGDKYFVVSKQLSGKGGYEIGDLKIERTRLLSENEWREFMNAVNQTSYWEFPSTVTESIPNDGAVWIVEGIKNGNYHWARRVTPSSQYTVLCKYLIKLSGLETHHELYLPHFPDSEVGQIAGNDRSIDIALMVEGYATHQGKTGVGLKGLLREGSVAKNFATIQIFRS
jgi:hypothetical protein